MSIKHITPKIEQKRATILEIALQLFASEGFRNTDVQIIADRASVGKGTVYRHFESKEGLFLATAKHALEQLLIHVEDEVGTEEELPTLLQQVGTLEVIRRIALSCAGFYEHCPQAIEIMIQERAEFRDVHPSHLMFRAETRAGFDEMLRLAIANGEIRDLDVTSATNTFADLLFGSIVNGCLEGGHKHLRARIEQAIDILVHGLAAKKSSSAKKNSKPRE